MVDSTTGYVLAIVFLATFVRTALGFGEALIAVPLLALRMPVTVATPLAVAVSVVVAGVSVSRDWRHVDLRDARWLIGTSFIGLPFGVLLLKEASDRMVHLLLGAIIIGVSLYWLRGRARMRLDEGHRGWLLGAGFCSGVLGGAYGMNGPPLAIYGALRGWSATKFRATLQAYFLVASIAACAGFATVGLWRPPVGHYLLVSLPAVAIAIGVARLVGRHLEGERFFRIVFTGLVAIGAVLVAQGLAR